MGPLSVKSAEAIVKPKTRDEVRALCFGIGICLRSSRGFSLCSSNMSDEADEIVDPKADLEEWCKPKCVKPLLEYQACVKRVEQDTTGHKHCTGQYFDFWACIDKCVAPKLFNKTK